MTKCCIHVLGRGEEEQYEVMKFTEKSLKKCRSVLRARSFHKLKYSNFQLPPTHSDQNYGYHSKCYKLFTAVKVSNLLSVPVDYGVPSASTPSASTPSSSTSSQNVRKQSLRSVKTEKRAGVLGDFCIFCRKKKYHYKSMYQPLFTCRTSGFEEKVIRAAEVLSDFRLRALLVDGDMCAKEAQYHKICSSRYIAKAQIKQRQKTTGPSDLFKHRAANTQAFNFLYDYIQERIIDGHEMITTKDLFKVYRGARKEICPETTYDEIDNYPLPDFEQKILCKFSSKLLLDKRSKLHILFSSSMNCQENLIQKQLEEMSKRSLLTEAAQELRHLIISTERKPLGTNIALDDIQRGECKIPTTVVNFFQDIMRGPSSHDLRNATHRRADSLAQDLMFCTTNGRIKPPKHLMLGSAIKSLTNSKKLLTLLNRNGHTASYSTVEELETEMSYTALESSSILPLSITPRPDLCTMVAFNNFDRFVDTATGKGTLHDTVAVVYQNIVQNDEVSSHSSTASGDISTATNRQRRRRVFNETYGDITPYNIKPTKPFEISLTIPSVNISTVDFSGIDTAWMMRVAHCLPKTPMWVGFNSLLFSDQLPIQRVAYLPQINHSPTSYTVVAQTLKIAQNVAEECGQHGIICAYDLAIARMALQIQHEEAPMYDDVFIMLGAFHVELSFFKALGKIIEGSGITEILEECNLIASGSLSGFLGGSHYNRCKRIHQYLAVSIRVLHYQLFLNYCNEGNVSVNVDGVKYILQQMDSLVLSGDKGISLDPTILDHIEKYKAFESSTLTGEHGATPQFWMKYIRLYNMYQQLSRSIRMGNTMLFLEALCSMTNLFFGVNHQNYARWLVVFTDKLKHGLERRDSVGAQLRAGIISVRRTTKNFSRTALDLTLEQTVNADAANKMTGITSFTNSITARQRWAVSHSARTQLISHVMEDAGITKKEDVTSQLKPSKIERDNKIVRNLLQMFDKFLNPFSEELQKEHLYNLTTGKAAPPEVKEFLLSVEDCGQEQHEKFRAECSIDPARFKKPIKRNKISNFSSANVRLKVAKQGTVHELKQERNMFARLVTIAMDNTIDLRKVLAYPLTPVPLSLAHSDGTKLSTPKSTLLHQLEGLCDHEPPQCVDVLIIDGFYFLHTLSNSQSLPSSYGMIADAVLKKLSRMKAKVIHLVFDTYEEPSIKDTERNKRSSGMNRHQVFSISNPSQRLSGDIAKLLKIDNFKEALAQFLVSEWLKESYICYFESFTLIVNEKHATYQFTKAGEFVRRLEVELYSNKHVEADSKIGYIMTKIDSGNVVVRTSDTDVLVIILGNMHHISNNVHVWMETGFMSNSTHRFINVSSIHQHLGPTLSRALPAFHALTGCDYTASFHRMGKKKPLTIIKSNPGYASVLAKFGDDSQLLSEEIAAMHKIVCSFYSKKPISDPDELRLQMFTDVFSKRSNSQPLQVRKGIESRNFPPCKTVLNKKLLRTKFVTRMWTSVGDTDPPATSPAEYGWYLEDGTYHIDWFTGPCLPPSLGDIVLDHQEGNELEDEHLSDEEIIATTDDDSSEED